MAKPNPELLPIPIPPNDETHPRWLLDLTEWCVKDYNNITFDTDPTKSGHGYGIISYTWGMYWQNRDDTVPIADAPKGIDWKIPLLQKGAITLAEAKTVIDSMAKRYVWWDWMCVPQGGKHKDVAKQEIGKQMVIYRNAKASIIWLHDTDWSKNSVTKSFLRNRPPKAPLQQYLQSFVSNLQQIKEREPWLTSIWTLQEGVLLNHSRLVDRHGAQLLDNPADKRFHDDQATVIDLATVPAKIARDIAMALFAGEGNPDDLFRRFVADQTTRVWVQGILCQIIRSGLFGYYDKPVPLAILAGKGSRRYDKATNPDQYWALIGALDLDLTPPTDVTIEQAREIFFRALLKKYQWQLLLSPSPPIAFSSLGWAQVISDGHIIPLDDLFFAVEPLSSLPQISWAEGGAKNEEVIILGGAPMGVLRLVKTGYFRRYAQTRRGNQDLVDVQGPDTESPLVDARYLQIAKLQGKFGLGGRRCIEIRNWDRGSKGVFNGVVDLWVPESDVIIELTGRISLYLPTDIL